MSKDAQRLLKKLGTKLLPGCKILGFKGRPPLRINQNLISDPIGDQLLTGSWPVLSQPVSELGLGSASSLDGSLQCGDVVAHTKALYTNQLVPVNMPVCVTQDKKVCNVVDLVTYRNAAVPNTARKTNPARQSKPRKERKAIPGPDGKTLGQRLEIAMAHRAGMLRKPYEPVDLLADANSIAGATLDAPLISQQMISEILRNRTTRSSFTPYLAKACGVSPLWLANGRLPMVE